MWHVPHPPVSYLLGASRSGQRGHALRQCASFCYSCATLGTRFQCTLMILLPMAGMAIFLVPA